MNCATYNIHAPYAVTPRGISLIRLAEAAPQPGELIKTAFMQRKPLMTADDR